MVRSCERVGWSGGKLDFVWTSLVCIDDSVWFLKAWLCCSRLFLMVIFGALSWWFSWCVFGTLLLGLWWGKYVWTLRGSFIFDSPPNPWVKGLDFGVFGVLGLEEFLAGFLQFLLFSQDFVGINLAMDSSWGVPTIPKVLCQSVEWFGRWGLDLGELTRGCSSPRAAQAWLVWPVRVTGLTGVCHLWDLHRVNCLTHVSLGHGASGQFLVYLELFC
jgi:hypothetical protein